MNSRISLVLKAKNISPAQLADELGVQRSGISHILNARNKPSLDFIQKLLKRYPDISMSWLMFGDGPMMVPYPNEVFKKDQYEAKPAVIDLFSSANHDGLENLKPEAVKSEKNDLNLTENEIITPQFSEMSNHNEKTQDKDDLFIVEKSLNSLTEMNPQPGSIVKKKPGIARIVIFYDDKTFVEYTQGKD
ncbi:MAG TPA: helix-turn-helix transcriptional regulator [Lentimicrobium sp.]|jgi:transcriptional regulator with XRE-family HTH domain|nr:helix-turn-helix transcriptional regulator [Lentimicrobium sp.]